MQRAKQQQDIELSHQLDIFIANEIDDAIKEEIESAILESAAGKHNCADMVKVLKEELAACYTKIKKLSDEITVLQQHVCFAVPFSEQSLLYAVLYYLTQFIYILSRQYLTMCTRQCQEKGPPSCPPFKNLCVSC